MYCMPYFLSLDCRIEWLTVSMLYLGLKLWKLHKMFVVKGFRYLIYKVYQAVTRALARSKVIYYILYYCILLLLEIKEKQM